MSPDPENPGQGKAGDTSPDDAAEAKQNVEETPAQPESAATSDAEPMAEGTAAAETGIDKLAAGVEEAPAEGSDADAIDPDETEDQQERADAEAVRAAAAAEEAAEAAEEAGTETAVVAAAEAEEAAEKASAAAESAESKPKREKSRKAREAAQAADQAEEAADEAKKSARRVRGRRGGGSEPKEEPKAVPVGLKVSAQAKYVRTSARKARLVCDHIRGKDVTEARAILAFTPRSAAKPWLKLLESAVANAEHNHELVGEDLRIFNVHADEGPTLKRYRPRAMGRATRIRKRTAHLSITLTPKES
jgi:ribosomal protein L22